jgi:hypothetical protein
MKSPRKIFVISAATLATAAAVLLYCINLAAGRHLESVQQELGKLLGLEVRFASLEVRLLGWPGFAAKELRVADDARFAATPVLRARELFLTVQLWPLLRGRVVIDALTLRQPEFQIIADETGLFNLALLAQRRKELAQAAPARPAPTVRKPATVSFAIDMLRIDDGRVNYLDRSVKEPAELQLADIDLTFHGLDAIKSSRVRIDAALTEGLGQDLHIDGEFSAGAGEESWLRRQMHLTIRADSLHLPVIARAFAALRDKIPREVEITGPMSFQARVAGSLAQPRFDDITLKAPLFGASDYNVTLMGGVIFSERRSWEDAELSGRLIANPLPLAQLRNLNWFRQNFSPALVTDGTIGLYANFAGTWDKLRIGALVRADKSDWKYQDWLHKPIDRPAELKAQIARRKEKLFIHESEFISGANRVGILGLVDVGNQPKLQLRLYSRQGRLSEWREMILPNLLGGATGQTDLNIVIDRNLLPEDSSWNAQGYLKLTDGVFNAAQSGRAIEAANGTVIFNGRQAKLESAGFRIGASFFTLNGIVDNLLDPDARCQLRSAQLDLNDLNLLRGGPAVQLKNFSATGAVRLHNGALVLEGSGASPEGRVGDFDFRDLRTDILWSARGVTIKNLSLRAFEGSWHADGFLASAANNGAPLELSTRADGIALGALALRLLPALQDKVQGQLSGHGRFASTSAPGAKTQNLLQGSGEALVQNGILKDLNLISQLLLRGSGASVSAHSMARLPPGFAKLLSRTDTVFDSLKSDFIVEPERIRTDNLVISTPDYTITGAGWIGFDRTTKWNGLIVLSPRLTQEVQRDIRLLRYLLDRRGRLTITFRVEGTIPNVRIRLDNRALAQTLRGGSGRDGERDGAAQPGGEAGGERRWLPDSLDRFLNR